MRNSEKPAGKCIQLPNFPERFDIQIEELSSGEGYVDVAYIPKADSDWPILLIELKWLESTESAINQILNKKYTYGLENYGRSILLVGISYDKDAGAGKKKHKCRIIEYTTSV